MMRLIAGAKRRLAKDPEAGITLVELLVAIVILGIVLSIASAFLVGSMKVVASAQATALGSNNSSNVMNEVSRVIRSGDDNPVVGNGVANPAFLTATAESLAMYSYVDAYDGSATKQTRPLIVQFGLDSTRRLVEKRWLPATSTGGYFTFGPIATTTPQYSRYVGGPIQLASTTPSMANPLFTYVDLTNTIITPPGGGFTAAQMRTIAAVIVTVRVRSGDSSTGAVTVLQNTVRIPNLGFTNG